jgi:S-DNA-T family DNA segregation ATPase FtsK/SpoIIIE
MASKKPSTGPDRSRLVRELAGLACLFFGLFLAVSLISFDPADPSVNQVVSRGHEISNWAGLIGAYMGGFLVDIFGVSAWLWPIFCCYLALVSFVPSAMLSWWRWIGVGTLGICLMALAEPAGWLRVGQVSGGGLLGQGIYTWSRFFLHAVGATLFWAFLFLLALQLAFGFTWASLYARAAPHLPDIPWSRLPRLPRPSLPKRKPRETKDTEKTEPAPRIGESGATQDETPREGPIHKLIGFFKKSAAFEVDNPGTDEGEIEEDFSLKGFHKKPDASAPEPRESYPQPVRKPKEPKPEPAPHRPGPAASVEEAELPPIEYLNPSTDQGPPMPKGRLEEMAESLVACLADFGIGGEVQDVVPGPVVSMFEYKPAPGVKISRIAGLSDDLALSLRAIAVRIEAIPGKDTVGIEIPNENRQVVYLRDIFEDQVFTAAKSKLTLALGKDIRGRPFAADLARMPHLLVAGATGAGKSVCLNTILLSILYRARPDEVKLLLVDPKRIELSVYGKLPHLVHPVVTDMAMAKSALDWAVQEMERRYDAMARLGVRNIDGYNQKLPTVADDPEFADLEQMPFLVLIIDELADLMMTAGKEAEASIVRLAQLARAAGIHLIIATQRPSVDVVTGLIKANFPSRISFQVTSKHDSRTILDTVGAERLLGRGDMLYKPSGARMMRLHGAFVSETEIAEVVNFWKAQVPQEFEVDFEAWQQEAEGAPEGTPGGMDNDPLYNEAVDFVYEQGKASISLIQRRFRIGYNRAARFVEQMEVDGMLGPQEGSKPRAVIKGRE